jgi:cell division septal protein FtsQ
MAKKKRRVNKIFKVLFIILVLVFILYIFPCYILDIRIKNIYIKNNNILTDKQIIEIANLEDYPNYYKINTFKIKKSLKSNPYIKDCKVYKGLFNKITIDITENKILFIRLDTKKIVFENKKEIDYDKELLSVPYLINYVPDTKYNTLIDKLNKIDDEVLYKISEIKYDPNKYDEDRFLLYMDDDNYVYVTLTKMNLLNKYNEAITKFEGKKGTLYLDSGNYFEIRK